METSEESSQRDFQDAPGQDVTDLYRELREHHGRLMSLALMPITVLVAASVERSRQRYLEKKAEIQQEERWRQEVRDEQ